MELKPIVFFNDHSSFVTSVTCTRDGRLYTAGLDRLLCVCGHTCCCSAFL
jgi:hypothetical protein